MSETRIDDVPELSQFLVALKSLGYRTTDQLIGAHRVAGRLLADYLRIDETHLQVLIDKIPHRPKLFGPEAVPPRKFALGVLVDRISRPRQAPRVSPESSEPLPQKVNMIGQMPPIRDQGDRLTCVAHACLALLEHSLKLQNRYQDMSEQYLYWRCKEADGEPDSRGTTIMVAMGLLQKDGCCLESSWGYNPEPMAGNEGQGPPIEKELKETEARSYRVSEIQQIAPTSIIDIKSELAHNRCVAFSIPVYASWLDNEAVRRTGEIVNPVPKEIEKGGHAMCFVGYEDIADEPDLDGGKFYIRNSWDSGWATESVLGVAGYGTIPYSYIERLGLEAYSIGPG